MTDRASPADAQVALRRIATLVAEGALPDEVGRLLDEQAALRRVATLVAEGTSPVDLFSAVAREVADLFGVGMVNIDRYENGESVVLASFDDPAFPVGSRWPLDGSGVRTLVYETGRPARVDDFTDVAGKAPAAARAWGIKSAVGVPIVVDRKVWGVLGFGWRENEPLPADTEQRLAAFTELVSTAIANAESRAELAVSEARARDLAEEQAALRRVATLVAEGTPPNEVLDAVAVEVGRLIGADLAVLSRYDENGGVRVLASRPDGTARELPFTTLPTVDPESLTAAVLRTGRPARVDDYAEASGPWAAQTRELGYRSAVGAPVTVQGRLWGVMMVTSTAAFSWPPDTEDRLAEFTGLLATAIANSDAREKVGRLLDEQAALRRVATLVARGVSQSEVLDALAKEINKLLDAGTTTVLRYEGTEAITVVASYGDFAHEPPIGTRVPLDGESVSAKVLRTGRPARMESFEGATGTIASLARELGVRSAVGAPIAVEGRLWVVTIGFCDPEPPPDVEHRLAAFTELAATAIANAESREELAASEMRARALADEQAALRRVATLVAEGATPDLVFDAVRQEVARMFNIPSTVLMRFDADGMGTLLATYGDYLGPVGTRWPLEGDTSAVARVHQTGRAARADYTREEVHGSLAQAARRGGVRYPVAVPVVVEGALWGVMSAGSYGPEPPPDLEGRLAKFTELLATAIANAESRADLAASEARARELANEQAALRRVATLVARDASPDALFSAVAKEVAAVIDVPVVAIHRYEADGTFTTLGVAGETQLTVGSRCGVKEGGIAGMILATGRPSRKEDFTGPLGDAVREDLRLPMVGVPIVVEGGIWGFMVAAAAKPDRLIPAGTEERLARFTELLATAIANAESRADLAASEAHARELAEEQAALRRVATLVAQGASPDELFSAVAKEVARIIDIPVVGVHRYDADGTVTTVGIAGETSLTVGTRLRVTDGGIAGMILSSGRPSRMDDYTSVPRDAVREDLRLPMVGVPIVVDGSVWGFMVAAAKRDSHIPAGTEERLVRFTELVATAVSNATTRTELLTSRARVVNAADETRRRLERDLHDGIQQWLVALALRARKAAAISTAGESGVQELSGLADDLVAVTDELREISRGIHPAILSDSGLDDALKALARRSAITVDLDVGFEGRYDPTLEATVYYVAAESITNAVKHAQASTVTVRGGRRNGAIELEIRDDGVGGADPQLGTGLIGLKDRVDTLGGTISFASPAGAGTTIRVKLPVYPCEGEDPPLSRSGEAASPTLSG